MGTLWGPVLLVDDESALLDVLERYLRQHNIAAIKAQTAEQALFELRNRDVRVIVCDNRLEHEGGMALLDLVGQWYPDVGRIIMTGDLSPEVSAYAYDREIQAIAKDEIDSHVMLVSFIRRELGLE